MWLTSGRASGRKKPAAPILFINTPGKGVLHAMKATCKYVEVLLAFAGYQQHSLWGLIVVSHRQECIQTDVDH